MGCVFLWMALSTGMSVVQAKEPPYHLQAGLSLSRFHYKEFDTDGGLLDREDGLLLGTNVSVELVSHPYTLALGLQGKRGEIDYRGHTQIDAPLVTTTEENIARYYISVSREFVIDAHPVALTAELGKRRWERDIRRTAVTNSLYEVYRWPYFLIGGAVTLWHNEKLDFGIKALVGQSFNSTLKVFISGYDTTTLNLSNGDTLLIGIPINYRWHAQKTLVIEPHVQYWYFEESPVAPLHRNGIATGSLIHEPENETLVLGITFAVRF